MRVASLVLALLSYIAPPVWAYFQIAAIPPPAPGSRFVCGMPIFAIVVMASVAMCVFSFVALAFAIPVFLRAPRPRSWARIAELGFSTLPLLVAAPFSAWVLGWFDA